MHLPVFKLPVRPVLQRLGGLDARFPGTQDITHPCPSFASSPLACFVLADSGKHRLLLAVGFER